MSYKDLKDLENNIKQESEKIDAPDVYHKVKDTPIRKLKKGQIAAKYISRKTGLAILAFLVLMVVIISVLCLALVLSDRTQDLEYSPVVATVSVENGGNTQSYIFLCENSGTIKYAINVDENKKITDAKDKGLLEIVKALGKGGVISTNIMSTSQSLQDNLYKELNSSLEITRMSDSDTLVFIKTFITGKLGEDAIDTTSDLNTYYSKLIEISETKISL